ncbi:MAG: hypothetical protein EZS28_043580, partial [Streblomastix strix]
MLLIFVLSAISLCAKFEKGRLYYETVQVDEKGVVTRDYNDYSQDTDFFKSEKITSFKKLSDQLNSTDPSFNIISKEGFSSLRTATVLTQEEQSCRA